MELWQVRKRYRPVASRLRRMKGRAFLARQEEQVLVTLLLGDRLETERSVLRFALRCTSARLKRVRACLEGASILADAHVPLVKRADDLALDEFERRLRPQGAHETIAVIEQLRHEKERIEHRLEETQERLKRVGARAAEHLSELQALLKAHEGLPQSVPRVPQALNHPTS